MGSCFGDPFQPAIELALGQCDTCVVFFVPDKDQCRITLFPLLGCIDLLASYEKGTRYGRGQTNSLPEWRWEAVIAALEDPSIEVQQAAVEWLAALSEQRYAPPQGATSKRLCELLKARLVPTNTDGFYVLRALPWVDPACAGAAPQVADLLTNSDEGLRVAAGEALGSMGPAAASFRRRWPIC